MLKLLYMNDLLIKIIVFVFGSTVGSFLNVCIYRMPREESVVKPRSHCTSCNRLINWYDNIPFLSFIALGGRCRFCKARISPRYFMVELLTAAIFLVLYNQFGLSVQAVKFAIFMSCLIATSFIDIEHRIVPWKIPALGILTGIFFAIPDTFYYIRNSDYGSLHISINSTLPIVNCMVGIWLGYGIVYFFKFFGDLCLYLYLAFTKKESFEGEQEAMGLGDVDLMGMIGAFLGWKLTILTFFIAPFLGAIYGIYVLIRRKSHLIPYVPFLAGGSLVAFFWGKEILRFLFRYSI